MGKAADRRRWVDRYLQLPEDEQAELLSAVKATARNMEKLAQELALAVDDG
jgi:diadenosine tetraphosphate (Ap4A) HIT family hydrolase